MTYLWFNALKPPPTDLQVLNGIYEEYYGSFSQKKKQRITPNFVPIDIE